MARSVVGYIGANGINNMASTSSTSSVETTTGLPINTGLEVGTFRELGAGSATQYSYTTPTTAYPWGQLYEGLYMWVQLDPTVATDPIPLGTALAWLTANQTPTVTTLNTTTNADFAGISIDSNFGKSHPYAYICVSGKVLALFDATANTAFGDVISLSTATQGSVTRTGASNNATNGLTIGIALTTTGVASTRNLIRIIRAQARY